MSEFAEMLRDQAGRLFGDLINRELLIEIERGGSPIALNEAVVDFGLIEALAVPACEGGLSYADAGTLFSLLGEYAAPMPLGETMLATAMLARAGIEAPSGLIGVDDRGEVVFGNQVDHVVAQGDGSLLLLPKPVDATEPSISRQPRGITPSNVAAVVLAPWPDALPDLQTLGAMLRASQIAGCIRRVLALSVTYANERKQFGRPIGRFQAVQQLSAQLAAEAAAAQSAADVAWASLDAGRLGHAGAVAKIRAGMAARHAAAIAHQVHGAIGVTDEHMLHYFTRRLWEWRLDFGSEGRWAGDLGRAARTTEGGIWQFLTTTCGAPAAAKEI